MPDWFKEVLCIVGVGLFALHAGNSVHTLLQKWKSSKAPSAPHKHPSFQEGPLHPPARATSSLRNLPQSFPDEG